MKMGKPHSFLCICFHLWLMIHLLGESNWGHLTAAAATRNTSSIVRCKMHEREALLKFKQIYNSSYISLRDSSLFIMGAKSNPVDNWVSEDCCKWQGVSCDYATGNVIALELRLILELSHLSHRVCSYINSCGGPYHESISNPVFMPLLGLQHLRILNLSHSYILGGDLLPQLSNLTNLEVLDLSSNYFRGSIIPPEFGYLTNLKVLNLSSNKLAGSIPLQLGNLTNLKVLDLSSNELTGSIPLQLGNLTNLKVLDLSTNGLTGSIPLQLGNLTKLKVLDLSFNELTGSIPLQLGNLTNLKVLDLSSNALTQSMHSFYRFFPPYLWLLNLSRNSFYGQISDSLIKHLSSLKFLDLSYNRFHGTLPSSLGQLKELKHLDLSSNSIQGAVSLTHIGNLTKLSYLDVSNNNLSFNLPYDWLPPFQLQNLFLRSCQINNPPMWLRTQASIIELDLSNTGSSGKVDYFLSNMSNLYGLNLSNNFFTGSLPQQFATQHLQSLDIHNNSLSGNLPDWFGHLNTVDYIDLSSNQFTGSLPSSLGKNQELQFLFLNNNSLEGVIPPSLGNCNSLVVLDLSENKLSGGIPQCNLESLVILKLKSNKLSGRIPDCWGNSTQLQVVNLSSNKLSGVIPCSFGNITALQHLHLNDNELNGSIPSCLSHSELVILDVGGNKLSGSLTTLLKGHRESLVFPYLEVLRLPGNTLSGTIPHQLCTIPYLHVLDLSKNQLIGNIPPCLGKLTYINQLESNQSMYDEDGPYFLYQFEPILHGSPKTIDVTRENGVNETIAGIAHQYSTILKYLTTIDLSSNYLKGAIPEELTKLSGLMALNLSRNQLTGKIPEKIGKMKELETLDLSQNKLCGRIPVSLGNIDSLNHINFSFNNFSGPIPSSNHLDTLEAPSVFMGNPYLCGDILPKKCSNQDEEPIPNPSRDEDEDDAEDKHENLWFYLVVMTGVATGFWGVITTLLLKKSWRHALFRPVEDVSDWLYVAIALKVSKLKNLITSDDRSG